MIDSQFHSLRYLPQNQFKPTAATSIPFSVLHEFVQLPLSSAYASTSTSTTTTNSPISSTSSSPAPRPRSYNQQHPTACRTFIYSPYLSASLPINERTLCCFSSMPEIEELPRDDNEDGSDSGIELLHGEFEEPPDNYGEENDNDDSTSEYCSDDGDDEQQLLHGLQRLRYNSTGIFKKRTYAESVDGDSDYESGSAQGDNIDGSDIGVHDGDASSGSGGRIRRRKLGSSSSTGWVSGDGSRDVSSRSSPELEFVMEMDI